MGIHSFCSFQFAWENVLVEESFLLKKKILFGKDTELLPGFVRMVRTIYGMELTFRGKAMKIAIQSVREDWPDLQEVPGIGAYWNRALMLHGGAVVVHAHEGDKELQLLLEDYRMLGIGPDKVIFVEPKTNSLYGDLLANKAAMRQIRVLMRQGAKLDIFCSSEAAEKFLRCGGWSWSDTVNPTLEHYEQWRLKDSMRVQLREAGLGHLCFSHAHVHTKAQLRHWVRHYGENGVNAVVFKRADGASSEGMEFRRKGEMPSDAFMRRHWNPAVGLIVEAAAEHHPFSLSYHVGDDGVEFEYATVQWQGVRNPIGELIGFDQLLRQDLSHRGNLVGPVGADHGPLTWAQIELAEKATHHAMELVHRSGFRGGNGVDLAAVNEMNARVLEMNPRTRHGTFVAACQRAISKTLGSPVFALCANIEVPVGISTYHQLRQIPSNFADDVATSGLLFYHTPMLAHLHRHEDGTPYRKAGIIAFAPTFEGVRDTFEQAQAEILSAT